MARVEASCSIVWGCGEVLSTMVEKIFDICLPIISQHTHSIAFKRGPPKKWGRWMFYKNWVGWMTVFSFLSSVHFHNFPPDASMGGTRSGKNNKRPPTQFVIFWMYLNRVRQSLRNSTPKDKPFLYQKKTINFSSQNPRNETRFNGNGFCEWIFRQEISHW